MDKDDSDQQWALAHVVFHAKWIGVKDLKSIGWKCFDQKVITSDSNTVDMLTDCDRLYNRIREI